MGARMLHRKNVLKSAAFSAALTFCPAGFAAAEAPMPVVATFSILGDMVARIGAEHIALTTLVGPDGDTHVYQPTPADAKAVANAEVLFVNGLEFEGWLERLAEASSFRGEPVVATAGIDPIAFQDHDDDEDHSDHNDHDHKEGHAHDEHDHKEGHAHGEYDPHAWHSVTKALVYVENITQALIDADPAHADAFRANRDLYIMELEALEAEITALMTAIPENRRTVVTSHDAFGYFETRYGLTFLAPQGLSTESEASAADVARLIEQIRSDGISAVFVETVTDNRMMEQIARETGAAIGGTLYADALSGPDGPAATYIDMMRYNAATIAGALGS